ncbi:MAG: glycosyltransferase family 4 protein [Candidatus Bathyarchaeia archaeon]
MRKYRILFIDEWGDWGGAESVLLTLIRYLDRKAYDPYFVCGSEGLFTKALAAEGIPVEIVPTTPMIPLSSKLSLPLFLYENGRKIIRFTSGIYLVIRRIRPEIIHTCSIQAKIAGSFAAKRAGTKLLWHVQNIQPPGIRRKFVHFLAKRFPDMIVATSQAVADSYAGAVQPNKICVNRAGIDLNRFAGVEKRSARRSLIAELGIAPNTKLVANVSAIRHWKGQHIFVEAAASVLKNFHNVMFLIVGEAQFAKDYKYKAWLIDLVNSLGIAERVKFLGFREDVPRIVAAVDCLVHCPLESDPLPNIVLEAMALQTPVVASSIGGIPEEIESGVTGLLVEPGNVEALSKAIIMVLENPDIAENFAQMAWHKVRTEFSPELFARRFEKIYAQLINGVNDRGC